MTLMTSARRNRHSSTAYARRWRPTEPTAHSMAFFQIARRENPQPAVLRVGEKRVERIGKAGEQDIVERVTAHCVRDWKVLIVRLSVGVSVGVIDSGAYAYYGIAMRPRDADSGVDVIVTRVEVGIRIRAESATGRKVERNASAIQRGEGVEHIVAEAGVDGQLRCDFPFVFHLCPRHVLPLTHQREYGHIGGCAHLVVQKVSRGGIAQSAAARCSLVQEQAFEFRSRTSGCGCVSTMTRHPTG